MINEEETFQEVDTLMLVGHNPGLTGLNDLLSDKSIYNLVTAAVVVIEFDKEVGSHKGYNEPHNSNHLKQLSYSK